MGGGAIEILVVVAVLWALLFVWVAMVVVRGVFRGLGRLIGFVGDRAPTQKRICPRLRCGADNPVQARFCRRCGSLLARNGRQRTRVAA
jgi:ribosomal protein L40E